MKLSGNVLISVFALCFGPSFQASHDYGYEKGMPYSFAYKVNDAYTYNDYGHKEQSDGYVTTGEYFVNLPDGRTQVVKYISDHNGYRADVSYIGEVKYEEPLYKKTYQPTQARPIYPIPAYPQLESSKPDYKPGSYPQNYVPKYGGVPGYRAGYKKRHGTTVSPVQ